jgi:hypothetical protein
MLNTLYSYRIVMKFECLEIFLKITSVSNLMKIFPVGAELFSSFRTLDGQKDRRT